MSTENNPPVQLTLDDSDDPLMMELWDGSTIDRILRQGYIVPTLWTQEARDRNYYFALRTPFSEELNEKFVRISMGYLKQLLQKAQFRAQTDQLTSQHLLDVLQWNLS
jgi:hypothetical protein